jgi:hypothetical protein
VLIGLAVLQEVDEILDLGAPLRGQRLQLLKQNLFDLRVHAMLLLTINRSRRLGDEGIDGAQERFLIALRQGIDGLQATREAAVPQARCATRLALQP